MKKLIKIILSFVCLLALTGFSDVSAEEKKGSINIELEDGWAGTLKKDVGFQVTQVGNIINGEYSLIDDLNDIDIDLNEIETAEKLQEIADMLVEVTKDRDIENTVKKTDAKGRVSFENLNAGIYLIENTDRKDYDNISATLIAIPTYMENHTNSMNYDVKVIPKHSPVIKVEISKQDITTQKELEGAKLTVTDKETGKVVNQWTSGKTPHIIKDLDVGKTYILTEVIAPKNYQKAESIEFTVEDTGEVQQVIMYDELMPVKVKTGDDTNVLLYFGLGAISLAIFVIVAGLILYRKRKQEN